MTDNTINTIEFDNPLPPRVIETTRALYAPPGGETYWATLETRIMARLANTAPAQWWQVLGNWARSGLVAAVAVIGIVSVLLVHSNREQLQVAYDAVVRPAPAESLAIPSGLLTENDDSLVSGETFHDALSY